jgi:hypothetical protein
VSPTATSRRRGGDPSAGAAPLPPRRKWLAITVATVILAFAFWAILYALVAIDRGERADTVNPAASLAVGLALVPFVFMVLAFGSGHPRAPVAVLKAMGLSLVVGILVSPLTFDAVTGIVAGVGAGGIVALRMDDAHNWKARAIAVVMAAAYTFVLARIGGAIVLLAAPIFPLTGIGVADHLSELRRAREAESSSA